jgi:glycosyltransferase 2 family protein
LNWRLLAIPASIVPFLIMFIFTPVSINDVFAVGLIPFIISAGSMIVKIMLQGYRFKYFIDKFIGPNVSSTGKIISARLAGEFVTQTTPSYVGGELVRIAWLTKNGVSAGKAAWVTTMEIIADVFVGTMLGFIAGAVAIYNGGIFIGVIVIIVAIPTLFFWLLLVIFSAKRNLRLPSFSLKILQKFVAKEKAERLINTTNNAITDVCKMSRENFNSIKAVRTFAVGIGITFIAFLFQGISFMVLADAVGSNIGLFDSLMATSASIILATLPITIGGSGLAELGIWAYISNLNSVPHFTDVIKDSQLNVIIAWRIASYHIPLVIMWIALMKITVRSKVSVINQNISIYSSNHSVKPNLVDSNASKNNNNNNNKPLTRLVRIIKGSSRRKIDVNKK